ncbi:MAG: DUF6328 family protein [Marmoricola sp.]
MAESDAQDHESEAERLDRNWSELLQELRVTQTGIQVLTGFLLTVPFSNRFTQLTGLQRGTYLAVLCGAVVSTALVMTPAACHRVLFRRNERPWLVAMANQVARAGLALVGLTTCGVAFLVFDVVVGATGGIIAAVAALVVFTGLWLVLPLRLPHPEEGRNVGTAPGRHD